MGQKGNIIDFGRSNDTLPDSCRRDAGNRLG